MKKLSIITINYNNKKGLYKTILSVKSQDTNLFEYIIVDGASDDGSIELIKESNNIVDKWVSEKDGGVYCAMNKGVALSSSDYCLFLNSGDCLYNSKVISSLIPLLDSGEDFIQGDELVTRNGKPFYYYKSPKNVSLLFFVHSSLRHQASIISTKVLRELKYDEKYKIASDWKFGIESLIIKNCSYKSIPLLIDSFDGRGISNKRYTELKDENLMILKELFPKRVLTDYLKDRSLLKKILDRLNFYIVRLYVLTKF